MSHYDPVCGAEVHPPGGGRGRGPTLRLRPGSGRTGPGEEVESYGCGAAGAGPSSIEGVRQVSGSACTPAL
jgi:hypothetical protein